MAAVPTHNPDITYNEWTGDLSSEGKCVRGREVHIFYDHTNTNHWQPFGSGKTYEDPINPNPSFGHFFVQGSGPSQASYKFLFPEKVVVRTANKLVICSKFTYVLAY